MIEFARNVANLEGASSIEFGECDHPVIGFMPGKPEITGLGGAMRLGTFPCVLTEGSLSSAAYQEKVIHERHRHRYEINQEYLEPLVQAGFLVSGRSPDGNLVEIMELDDHPWFVGTIFQPEFKSRPTNPHPLFVSFIRAILDK